MPVHWGVMPRITVWTQKKIKDALNADIFPSGDYGKMKVHCFHCINVFEIGSYMMFMCQ